MLMRLQWRDGDKTPKLYLAAYQNNIQRRAYHLKIENYELWGLTLASTIRIRKEQHPVLLTKKNQYLINKMALFLPIRIRNVKIVGLRELGEISKGENIVKWRKGKSISWLGHLEGMKEDRMPKKIFTQELEGTRRRGRPRKNGKRK